MDRQRARTCPPGGDPGGAGPAGGGPPRSPGCTCVPPAARRREPVCRRLVLAVLLLAGRRGRPAAGAGTGADRPVAASRPAPPLTLLSQTGWVTAGPGLRPPAPDRRARGAGGPARHHRGRLPLPVEHLRLRPVDAVDGPRHPGVVHDVGACRRLASRPARWGRRPLDAGGGGQRRPASAASLPPSPSTSARRRAVPVVPGRGVSRPDPARRHLGGRRCSARSPPTSSTARRRPPPSACGSPSVLPVQVTQGAAALPAAGRLLARPASALATPPGRPSTP